MNKTWKWILGITLGFVILVGVGFLAANFFGFGHMSFWGGPAYYGHPMMDGYGFGNREFRQPMMGGRGFGGFGFLGLPFLFVGGLLRLLFPLAVLALVAYFAYQQGLKAGMKAARVEPAPESEEAE
jgi:hypothetical protein